MHVFLYKKPSSRPSTKSFLIFGHVVVQKDSLKFLNLTNLSAVKAYTERDCSKLFVLCKQKASVRIRFKAMSYSHSFGTALC